MRGWGRINGQQEMKTGWKDGAGVEGKRVMGVVGSRRRTWRRKKERTTTVKMVWEEEELMPETGVIKGVKCVCVRVCVGIIAGLCADNVL